MILASSIDWWVLPSPKSESPQLDPHIFTLALGMAMEQRI
jgi:hypothetical protein